MQFGELMEQMNLDLEANSYRSALRKCLWFAYGFHLRQSEHADPEIYVEKLRRFILETGGRKSEASARVKTTRIVGSRLLGIFPQELAATDGKPAQRIALMFDGLEIRGISSVQKLQHFAEKTG